MTDSWSTPRGLRPHRNFISAIAQLVATDDYLGMSEQAFVGAAMRLAGGGLNPKEVAAAYQRLIAEAGVKVEPTKIEGAKTVVGLPASASPWELALLNSDVIAVSETEGAYIIREGRAEKITLKQST